MPFFSTSERGSALMLAPAGVVVLLILGAISVDSAIAFSAHRELTNQATAAVNDAATLSLTDFELQRGSEAQMDARLAERIVRERLASVNQRGLRVDPAATVVSVDEQAGTISVVAEADADYIFSRSIPGARDRAHVKVSASARLQRRSAI